MHAYLLSWNPKYGRPASLAEMAGKIRNGTTYEFSWSTGMTKDVAIGSRVFLVRKGQPPRGIVATRYRGIVAAGYTLSKPERRKVSGDSSNYARVQWTSAIESTDGALSLEQLRQEPILAEFNWQFQGGGRVLDHDQSLAVENLWSSHLRSMGLCELVPDME